MILSIYWKDKNRAITEEYCNSPNKVGRKHDLCFIKSILPIGERIVIYTFDNIIIETAEELRLCDKNKIIGTVYFDGTTDLSN